MAMKDYYEILGVANTATKAEIKKAYFGLVRQHSPEKEPEKFKEYRKAYEVLIDENARTEYDNINSIPIFLRETFDSGQEMMSFGDYAQAIKCFKEILDYSPDLLIVNIMLAEAYRMNGNPGNAIKICEKLVGLEPNNSAYQNALGIAYMERGFTNKAKKHFEKALMLEPENIDAYVSLVNIYLNEGAYKKAKAKLQEGLRYTSDKALDDTELLICQVLICIREKNTQLLSDCLHLINQRADKDPTRKEKIGYLLFAQVFNSGPLVDCMEEYLIVVNFVAKLLPEIPEIQEIQQNFTHYTIINILENDAHVPDVITDLTQNSIENCDCPTCQVERFSMKSVILERIGEMRSVLRYLRKNYPEVFALQADFYTNVLNPKKETKLLENQIKQYGKLRKLFPEEFGEDDWADEKPLMKVQKPYVKEVKVSRNAPCPCGSGKKYKKCCGR